MIYVFDLDGTICFDGKTIAPELIAELKKLETEVNSLIFASARPIRDMLPLLDDFADNFLIGGNGSIVRKYGQIEIVSALEMGAILDFIQKHDLDYLIDSDWDYSLKNRNDALAKINDKIDARQLAKNLTLGEIEQKAVIKVNLLNVPDALKPDFPGLEITKESGTSNYEITAPNTNKYKTLRKYFSEPYIAFGNDGNDIELLKHAKISVEVGDYAGLAFADFHTANITKFLGEKHGRHRSNHGFQLRLGNHERGNYNFRRLRHFL